MQIVHQNGRSSRSEKILPPIVSRKLPERILCRRQCLLRHPACASALATPNLENCPNLSQKHLKCCHDLFARARNEVEKKRDVYLSDCEIAPYPLRQRNSRILTKPAPNLEAGEY